MMNRVEQITHVVINTQVLSNRLQNSEIRQDFKQRLKNTCNNFLSTLTEVEVEWYDKFFNRSEKSTEDIYQIYDNFMQKIANVPIYDMQNISRIIQAYNKDKKSIEGIVNKILR